MYGVDTDPSVGTPFGPVALDIYTTDAVDTGVDVPNYAFLQSNTGPGNTFISYMLQYVTFQPDTAYTLSFVAAARSSFDNGGYDSGSNTLVVLYSDDAGATETTIESYVQDNGDISDLYFTQYTVNFTTDSDADAGYLKFQNPNADEALDQTVVFSNVSLTEATAGIEGDLNDDGFVGLDDLDIILSAWNQSIPPADSAADPSGDGFVGLDDLDIVLNNWNAGTPPAASAVPEPACLALFGLVHRWLNWRKKYTLRNQSHNRCLAYM